MNHDETGLDLFVARLKSGEVEFYTRHQEEEWGCRYLGHDRFLKWSGNPLEERYDECVLTEAQVRAIFARYEVKTLCARLVERESTGPF